MARSLSLSVTAENAHIDTLQYDQIKGGSVRQCRLFAADCLRRCFCPCVRPRLDESLWRSVDLEGLTHMDPALQQVLKTGVQRLRCPRSFVEELRFTDAG